MEAGKLDRRIQILRASKTTNSLNEEIETWPVLTTVWAAKRDVSDGERMRAQEVEAEITTRFTLRWSSAVADVNPKDRVLYAGKTYDIFSVKEIGRRDGIEITATARSD